MNCESVVNLSSAVQLLSLVTATQLDSELRVGDGQVGEGFLLEPPASFVNSRFVFSYRGSEEDSHLAFWMISLVKETTLPGFESVIH